jgi:pimeloyl-ACP methyl ester carboxylesterase
MEVRMSAFILVPGAGGAAWYWHRVVPELRARGHEAVAVDLPGAGDAAGLPEYADADVAAAGEAHSFPEADIAFGQPCTIERWPDVTTRVLGGRDDRFFPLEFQRQTARDRLGLGIDVIPGGHLVALSHPAELADRLDQYVTRRPPRGTVLIQLSKRLTLRPPLAIVRGGAEALRSASPYFT